MKYFINTPYTAESLKSEYREFCKKLHPDTGGNAEAFKEMLNEYTQVLKNLEFAKSADDLRQKMNAEREAREREEAEERARAEREREEERRRKKENSWWNRAKRGLRKLGTDIVSDDE